MLFHLNTLGLLDHDGNPLAPEQLEIPTVESAEGA
jgi:hypothetical protein